MKRKIKVVSAPVALVTGAAKRIGKACALALAREGFDLVLHYFQSRREAASLARRIRAMGRKACLVRGDLTISGSADRVFLQALECAGRIDLVLNNASIYKKDRSGRVSAAEKKRNIEIHAVAPLVLGCRLAAQQTGGVVINILDSRMFVNDPKRRAYVRSKRMLYALTKTMAAELAPDVRVNGIAPGAILAPVGGASKAYLRRMAAANLLGRMGTPEDIAQAVVYLAGATFVTGQILFVDGGYGLAGSGKRQEGSGKR